MMNEVLNETMCMVLIGICMVASVVALSIRTTLPARLASLRLALRNVARRTIHTVDMKDYITESHADWCVEYERLKSQSKRGKDTYVPLI